MNFIVYFVFSRFLVQLPENNLQKILDSNIHKELKLQTQMSTSTMVLFDKNGILKKYDSALDILKEFFPVRLQFYVMRKKYYEGMLEAEALKLENQARFILEKNDKKIIMENIKRKDFISILIQRKYDSDPVKLWKTNNKIEEEETSKDDETEQQSDEMGKYDFDYLIQMTMKSMLRENVQELLKKRDDKKNELEVLRNSTPQMLWESDLDSFLEGLEQEEQKEQERSSGQVKPSKKIKGLKGFKIKSDADIYKPTKDIERIQPKIDFEKYQPKEKKERKKKEDNGGKKSGKKKEKIVDESQRKITSLITAATVATTASSANEDKTSDDEIKLISKPKQKLKLKQTTINFKPTKRKSDLSDDETPEKPKKQKVF